MRQGPPAKSSQALFDQEILRLAESNSIVLNTKQLSEISTHGRLLEKWGRRMNLTAIRDPIEIARRHFLESLIAGTLVMKQGMAGALVDLGSGNGFPGVPMGVVCREARPLILIDSSQKRAAFLRALLRELGWDSARVEVRRVESHDDLSKTTCSIFTSRGVVVTELIRSGLPFLESGGLGLFLRTSRSIQDDVGSLPSGVVVEEDFQLPNRREGIVVLRKL
jgi:16S rRNA (guanine527-N7)-methyltransferase